MGFWQVLSDDLPWTYTYLIIYQLSFHKHSIKHKFFGEFVGVIDKLKVKQVKIVPLISYIFTNKFDYKIKGSIILLAAFDWLSGDHAIWNHQTIRKLKFLHRRLSDYQHKMVA